MNGHVSKPIDPSSLFDTLERFASHGQGPAVPPREPAHPAVAEADELPDVPGLNAAEGLSRVAGNKKLYRKLLRQFSSTKADTAQRIASALAANDRALAERLAHTVRGVAGNIGAPAVQNAAAQLEKAIAGSLQRPRLKRGALRSRSASPTSFRDCTPHWKERMANRLGQAIPGRTRRPSNSCRATWPSRMAPRSPFRGGGA